jgi:hypothetical protein
MEWRSLDSFQCVALDAQGTVYAAEWTHDFDDPRQPGKSVVAVYIDGQPGPTFDDMGAAQEWCELEASKTARTIGGVR